MRSRTGRVSIAVLVLAATGCSVAPPAGTPVLEAFRPDGTGGPDEATLVAASHADGVSLRFEPGDVIELTIALEGDLATGEAVVPIVVHRAIMIHMGPDGPVGSLDDGTTWKPLLELVAGSLETSLAMSSKDRSNIAGVRVTARTR